jgi:hypothetical protein
MKYAKLIAPLIGGLVMAIIVAYRGAAEDNVVTPSEWVLLVIQGLMIVSVWGAANIPGWTRGKTLQAAIFAVLALLVTVVTNGISGDEWLQLAVTFLSAAGVALTPAPLTLPKARSGAGMASW